MYFDPLQKGTALTHELSLFLFCLFVINKFMYFCYLSNENEIQATLTSGLSRPWESVWLEGETVWKVDFGNCGTGVCAGNTTQRI